MTYEINPALVRTMAGRYDDAAAPLAGFDLPTTRVAADTFGHVELAAWFAAVADQVDEAGRAVHEGVTTMAANLRAAAHDAEVTDDAVAQNYTPPAGHGLRPRHAARPQPARDPGPDPVRRLPVTAPPSLELGATQDKTELVPGDVAAVRSNADAVEDQRTKVKDAGDDFAAVSSQDALDSGLTSMTFLMDRTKQIAKFDALVAVLDTTHDALTTYATALSTAQGEAQRAIEKWNEGEKATADARAAYNAQVEAYNKQVCAPPPPITSYGGPTLTVPSITAAPPGEFSDPGTALREEAQRILDEARKKLDSAGAAALHTLGAPEDEDGDGKQDSHSGDVDLLGADGSAEGPSISWNLWEKTFGTEEEGDDSPFKISLGKAEGSIYVFNAKGEFENYYGDVKVNGDGSVTVLGADGSAEATIDKDGVKINADGTLTLVGAEGSVHGSLGPAELGAEGKVFVGATGSGGLDIGKDGVHAGGELFVGGKLEGSISGDVGGIGGEGRGELSYGLGAAYDADIGMKDGKITIGTDVGLTFGVGGKIGGDVTIDVPEVYDNGKKVVDWIIPG